MARISSEKEEYDDQNGIQIQQIRILNNNNSSNPHKNSSKEVLFSLKSLSPWQSITRSVHLKMSKIVVFKTLVWVHLEAKELHLDSKMILHC